MRDLMELECIKFGGKKLNNIRYKDDTLLFADSEAEMQRLVKALVQASRKRGLKQNTSRTKMMVIPKGQKDTRTYIDVIGEELEQISR